MRARVSSARRPVQEGVTISLYSRKAAEDSCFRSRADSRWIAWFVGPSDVLFQAGRKVTLALYRPVSCRMFVKTISV